MSHKELEFKVHPSLAREFAKENEYGDEGTGVSMGRHGGFPECGPPAGAKIPSSMQGMLGAEKCTCELGKKSSMKLQEIEETGDA